ncbi:hypothetical protein POM88_007097 [Heracleum sosnowskyi]|uniref:Uncharacterized protein n=1 Tax=Heracleum sosnowskyi TaxID=360622 RepID=A0AAD8N5B1_9APIA|nr:hypothetical protein POM88_007097 [Heracleum sosnowskyi]
MLKRYFVLSASDVEEWYQNPESFHHEQDSVLWSEKLRPYAEELYIVLFETHSQLLGPVVVSILQEAMGGCPSTVSEITQGLLLKDAAYGAAAYVYYELSNYLIFKDWMLVLPPWLALSSLFLNCSVSLQNQVEVQNQVIINFRQFLSMKIASVNPMLYDFGMDSDAFMVKSESSSLEATQQPDVGHTQATNIFNTTSGGYSVMDTYALHQVQMSNIMSQPQVAKCVEIGLPELIILVVFSQDKLRPVLTDIRKHADNIKGSQIVTGMDGGNLKADKGRKHLEEEYLELEEKIIILFDVVENMSLMLKKLRKANPDLNFDIGPLSATPTSGQDDNNTPTTQGGTEF